MTDPDERHLSRAGLADRIRDALPYDLPIPGRPRVVLFIDPHRARLGLRAPTGAIPVPATGLEHLTARVVHHDGAPATEIAITDPALFLDGYPLLTAVADRIQLDDLPPAEALRVTLARLGHLLRPEDRLSHEAETGLFGELVLLTGLAHAAGPTTALTAWRGPQAEEHDFGLTDADVEVKTTTSERREHQISSLTQLVASPGRPLWLVSVQITRGGVAGTTLPELVTRIRGLLPTLTDRETFDRRLHAAGWRERHAGTCGQRWRLRAEPVAFTVDDHFPRLIPSHLAAARVDSGRISDVRYRIDLTAHPTAHPTGALASALTAAHLEPSQ